MEFLTSSFVVNILPTLAGLILVICYAPQLKKTYVTKDVRSFSLQFWVLLDIALAFFVINALSLLALGSGSYGYLFAEVLNVSMSIGMTVMILMYRNKGINLISLEDERKSFEFNDYIKDVKQYILPEEMEQLIVIKNDLKVAIENLDFDTVETKSLDFDNIFVPIKQRAHKAHEDKK